ncbi:50S ribosomal protein L21e [Candidatus Woesearchaeota archaeon]|nr:50S ribosomal protein L21e [Candidatus Woesearchaeota archaeon]
MKRIGRSRRKTRSTYSKHFRTKGKISLTKYFQTLKEGDKVLLQVEPSIHSGLYDPKYIGKSGTIKRRNGRCYEVTIMDRKKEKLLIVHPVHLRRQ